MIKAANKAILRVAPTSLRRRYVDHIPNSPNVKVDKRSVVNENPKGKQKRAPQKACTNKLELNQGITV